MRRSPTTISMIAPSNALDLGTRRLSFYDNIKTHKLKYKAKARDKRKDTRRAKLEGSGWSPKDTGEETPAFFMPQRYKLLYKMIQDQ
eukprot:CAMPEP_0176382538 /NCGR_PEP_ID=MMETSP0126-20121128/32766_1 /TAXON_ID=141414 ORGANISM="Strombidinopsis acuminatum, Strain SPMC142" /NCGR_SAMPLE_ID=MMETSP0126 /ASSEMBLY_ACC=CAM_ASM_000229 /LENGTH=86 /DNA_ID=CAMNT_0017747031 /DNA_START=31 /DNA_END=291 /DNA_ORIENTATION=-